MKPLCASAGRGPVKKEIEPKQKETEGEGDAPAARTRTGAGAAADKAAGEKRAVWRSAARTHRSSRYIRGLCQLIFHNWTRFGFGAHCFRTGNQLTMNFFRHTRPRGWGEEEGPPGRNQI